LLRSTNDRALVAEIKGFIVYCNRVEERGEVGAFTEATAFGDVLA
jgi:hypothetical protein